MIQAETRGEYFGCGMIQALEPGKFGNCRRDGSVPQSEMGERVDYETDPGFLGLYVVTILGQRLEFLWE